MFIMEGSTVARGQIREQLLPNVLAVLNSSRNDYCVTQVRYTSHIVSWLDDQLAKFSQLLEHLSLSPGSIF